MTQKSPTVAIFAGSSTPNDPAILDTARTLGAALGRAGFNINYGGGLRGVMGAMAEAACAAGAGVTAFTLEKYADEGQVGGASVFIVNNEQTRFQALCTHNAPVVLIALPGGPGTIREAWQATESAVYDGKPSVVLIKLGTYLEGVKKDFDLSVEAGLIKAEHKDKVKRLTVEETLQYLRQITAAPTAATRPSRRRNLDLQAIFAYFISP